MRTSILIASHPTARIDSRNHPIKLRLSNIINQQLPRSFDFPPIILHLLRILLRA